MLPPWKAPSMPITTHGSPASSPLTTTRPSSDSGTRPCGSSQGDSIRSNGSQYSWPVSSSSREKARARASSSTKLCRCHSACSSGRPATEAGMSLIFCCFRVCRLAAGLLHLQQAQADDARRGAEVVELVAAGHGMVREERVEHPPPDDVETVDRGPHAYRSRRVGARFEQDLQVTASHYADVRAPGGAVGRVILKV